MYIILGFIAAVIVIIEEYFAEKYLNLSIMQLSRCFIPIGAFALGVFNGSCMSLGVRIANKKLAAKTFIVVVLIGVITFIGIMIMEYKTLYITAIKVNYILVFFKFIALVVGGIFGIFVFIPMGYCDKCKKYHKEKEIFYSNQEDLKSLLNDNKVCIEDPINFANFVKSHKKKIKYKFSFIGEEYLGVLSYCEKCGNTILITKKYIVKAKHKFEKIEFRQYTNISRSYVDFLFLK